MTSSLGREQHLTLPVCPLSQGAPGAGQLLSSHGTVTLGQWPGLVCDFMSREGMPTTLMPREGGQFVSYTSNPSSPISHVPMFHPLQD